METSRQDDGALFEKGPRSIRSYGNAGHNTLQLVGVLYEERERLSAKRKLTLYWYNTTMGFLE